MTRKISIFSEQVSPKISDWNSNQFSEQMNIFVFEQKISKIRFFDLENCEQYQDAGFEIVEAFSPILWLIFSNGHFSRLDQYDFEKIFKIVYLDYAIIREVLSIKYSECTDSVLFQC